MKALKHLALRVFILTLLVSPALPFLPEKWSFQLPWVPLWGNVLKFDQVGIYGDFVGGFIGTIAFMVSLVILFISYQNQKETNKQNLEVQRQSSKQTVFDVRFYDMLKCHRENTAELEIEGKVGRRVFVSFIREFRKALSIVNALQDTDAAQMLTTTSKIDLAYLAFYYGVGPNSTRLLRAATDHLPKASVEKVILEMGRVQAAYRELLKKPEDKGDLASRYLANLSKAEWELVRITYQPFDGHQSRLGHYYRHLYQMMKFVHSYPDEDRRRSYAALVRAQLSNHEQALLCLNSISKIGSAWSGEDGFLQKYSMIKNIPECFFDSETEIDMEQLFPKMGFEYKEAETGDQRAKS
ncbi:putative phage abortive infection protein [Prosthecobacter sp.]|uniref:putative phage abortive infection protein n=1 Tax=Prosthecobacter sp. TaxID=1965333 RepID=UPI003BB1DFED